MNVDVNSVSANVIVSNSESKIDCTDPVDRAKVCSSSLCIRENCSNA